MSLLMKTAVRPDWVDYNGHMNDAAYAQVFSLAVDQLMDNLGMNETFRSEQQYSMFTLETHVCYLDEAHEDQNLLVTMQLLDDDAKRLHVFFTMTDEGGGKLATSEQMLMGMDMHTGRPSPFPEMIQNQIQQINHEQSTYSLPKEAGRTIGIKKR
ncbi:thioesterase family protein [Tuberibacillus sp. Marseille-P3662]|uniref:thioesterase family protein n=1 Tax=Tuberibacillus sp. Marseille-P3662 TaxID=1965358 RepID=UPI000A1CBA8D|nr:thioesterase family protein [Tuberibacillus sp. Marseille-P3662]